MSDSFAPQIETIPEQVRQGAAQALGVAIPGFSRLHGGTTNRTFRVAQAEQQGVFRAEAMPATPLPRAVAAQRLGQAAGVTVPDIVAFSVANEKSDYCWSLEHFLAGSAFDHTGFDSQATQAAARDLGRQ